MTFYRATCTYAKIDTDDSVLQKQAQTLRH